MWMIMCITVGLSVGHQTDRSTDAIVIICQCINVPESFAMLLDRLLSDGGGLTHRISKVMADYGF